jgi:carbon-monoxide dehydrogenase large subunit
MGRFGVGQAVRRNEDGRLLSGHGQFTSDLNLPDQAVAVFLRSVHAHGDLGAIDSAAARAADGVLAIYTAADVEAAGLGTLPCAGPVKNRDGSHMFVPVRTLLAKDRVRYVGEPVAMVVAETLTQAKDAAELIEVDYQPLPAVADTAGAAAPGAPTIWHEVPDNIAYRWHLGDEAGAAAAFAAASHVVAVDLVNNRVVSNPMEPRNALAEFAGGRYTLTCANQGGHHLKETLSTVVPGVAPDDIRVVTPDVGGGFGTRYALYHEQALSLWAAKLLGRPIKWVCERGESFISDSQGRDQVCHAELALDGDGRFLAVRLKTIANLGAYASNFGPSAPTEFSAPMITGAYHIAAVSVAVNGVYTNTVPVDVYRGVGRAEASYTIERLVDAAARELAMDPSDLRRLNFVPLSAMPYTSATGFSFETADFASNMDDAKAAADWDGFNARRGASRDHGRLRGIGMSIYVETCGGEDAEEAAIIFGADGAIEVHVGTQASGQGHETAFLQIVEERLGVEFGQIRLVQGDTDVIPRGVGTVGSRSLAVCGSAIAVTADKVIEKARAIAAHVLEAAEADLEFADGVFTVAGTDRTVTLMDVAVQSRDPAVAAAAGTEPGLDQRVHHTVAETTFPNGCHICEVEIDRDTGVVEIAHYTVVDDFGVVVNPLIVEGQVHGGIAQGLGQAMFEHTVYDDVSGQLLSASFMDYCMPRAGDLPAIDLSRNETPCTTNALGAKGCGEAGAIGAPPAAINAIIDAMAETGIDAFDMPATPQRVWQALQSAKGE